jgi:phosphoesterase RecJ-like protein
MVRTYQERLRGNGLRDKGDSKDIDGVVGVLRSEDSFLITSHLKPEGDSIGSQLALKLSLESLGKRCVVVNDDPVPEMFEFLPHSDRIVRPEQVDGVPPVSVLIDCGQWERAGEAGALASRAETALNIDHHPDSDGIGTYNYIDPVASASGEQIYEIAKRLGTLSYDTSLCIYVAIVSDTGGFRYSNTTAETHRITSELLKQGVKCNEVAYRLYESDPPNLVKAMGLALSEVRFRDGVAWAHLSREALESAGAWGRPLETEKIIRQMRTINDVRVVAFLTELGDGQVKVNLRARPGFDVGSLARDFGGGGHRQASGCTVKGSLAEVEKKILGEIFARLDRSG